jgi:hypothetical protein
LVFQPHRAHHKANHAWPGNVGRHRKLHLQLFLNGKSKTWNERKTVNLWPDTICNGFILVFFKIEQTSKEDFYMNVVPAEYHGRIIEKFRIYNHNEPFIRVKENTSIYEMSTFNWMYLYEQAEVGDSILKRKNEKILILKKWKNGDVIRINYFFDKGWSIVKRKW